MLCKVECFSPPFYQGEPFGSNISGRTSPLRWHNTRLGQRMFDDAQATKCPRDSEQALLNARKLASLENLYKQFKGEVRLGSVDPSQRSRS